VNRQSRALLAILIAGVIVVPIWWGTRQPDAPSDTTASRPNTNPPAAQPVPARGGTITATIRSEPATYNRIINNSIATEIFSQLTQGRLVRVNRATQELEPWLAEKWDRSSDGRRYTLTLRDGLTWSDGVPFTAADVLFSFAAANDPNSVITEGVRVGGKPLQATSPDPRTVVVVFPGPFGPGLRLLDNLVILPKHKLESALKTGSFGKTWPPTTPIADVVGLGPFVLKEHQPGVRLIYERNPRYWRKDARGVQLPYADRVVLEVVQQQDAELLRLQSGQIDFPQQNLRASDLAPLRPLVNQNKLQLISLGVSMDPDAFVFNLKPEYWAKDPRREWLTRKEFRQALSHAVDREAYANTVFLGEAVPIHGPVTPGNTEWFWPSIPRYLFSRDKARGLLKTLGLENRDQDEWLEDPEGDEVRFSVLVFSTNSVLIRSAEVVREDLRQVGVALDIVTLDSISIQKRVGSGQFDTAFINFIATDADPAISKDLWLSSGAAHYWNVGQKTPATEWEKQIDDLMAKQTAADDIQERKRLFIEVQRIFAENLPMLHFASPRIIVGASTRVFNLTPALSRPQLLWSTDTIAVRQ
jgi:peptide/nickel transport system substrate-binding protein